MNAMIKPEASMQKATSLGHLALHFRPGEGPLAVRFFELLGARIKTFGPFEDGNFFYIVALNNAAPDEADNIIFMSAMTNQQHELEKVLRAHLNADTAQPHPALQAWFDMKSREPEFFTHFGFHFSKLEDLEAAVQRIEAARREDPVFAARFQGIQILKARGAGDDPEITARMAASPVFSKTDKFPYGANIAQVHIRTDLFACGLSFLGAVVELDYVFVGAKRARNPFNDLVMA